MGVPYYFRYLMKNHPKMLHKEVPASVDVLYLDSNSIVYDCVHAMSADDSTKDAEWEARLVEAVLIKIRGYVAYCRPRRCFVAFDGVAPLSKMDQQRSRRHKTLFSVGDNSKPTWNTNAITPGTRFMKMLSKALQGLMEAPPLDVTMVVSSSEEAGEGENKAFTDLRSSSEIKGDVVVYGLDADLIMLSLLHLRYVVDKLWIFRDAPHFDDKKEKEEGCLHLDVGMLGRCILQEMGCCEKNQQTLDDYVFLCFFLGNDFLPHFPCLNIRTHGMPALLEMYGNISSRGQSKAYLVDAVTGTIHWALLHKWIALCAKKEPEWFTQEKVARDKMAQTMWRQKQKDMDVLDQAPLLFRGEEMYIDAPATVGWQKRYYRVLFGFEEAQQSVEEVCQQYKRGLAWVWQYYTRGCEDWRWRYPYTYAPLMADLARLNVVSKQSRKKGPVKSLTQLAYVLPKKNHVDLIPSPSLVQRLGTTYGHLYVDEVKEFHWSFCRYFWEAHPVLPVIPDEVVTEWESVT